MLVLSRKKDEKIVIGDDIVITIGEIRGGRVRISIEAPENVRIVRWEVLYGGEGDEVTANLTPKTPSPGSSGARPPGRRWRSRGKK